MKPTLKSFTKGCNIKEQNCVTLPLDGGAYPIFVRFLTELFNILGHKSWHSNHMKLTYLGGGLNAVSREKDFLISSSSEADSKDDILCELGELEWSLKRWIAELLWPEIMNDAMSLENTDNCCGLVEMGGDIPISSEDRCAEFIALCKLYAWGTSKKASKSGRTPKSPRRIKHRSVFFTQITSSTFYKKLVELGPESGIKICHTWVNSNSGNELFLAVISPEDYKELGTSTKKAKPSKKKQVVHS